MLILVLIATAICVLYLTAGYAAVRSDIPAEVQASLIVAWCGLGLFFSRDYASSFFVVAIITLVTMTLVAKLIRLRVLTFFALAALVATGAIFWHGASEVATWQGYDEKFPLESLSTRLAYERPPVVGTDDRATGNPIIQTASDAPVNNHSSVANNELENLESIYRSQEWSDQVFARRGALEHAHLSQVEKFINSPGFGAFRMAPPNRSLLDDSELQSYPAPIALDSQASDASAATETQQADLSAASADRQKALQPLNVQAQVDFANPLGYGYVQDLDHVAGFQPHGFRHAPVPPKGLRLVRVELVSLLKHREPMVYVSKDLPNMEQLEKAPVRSLDDFERRGLEKLLAGGNLEVEESPSQTRMLGSIRAVRQCVECHSVKRGDLLGAFSYVLALATAPPTNAQTIPLANERL